MNEYQILIVDDDPKQLKILTGHLIEFNPAYKLLIATNGQAGFEIALKNKPDLILMDWEMPVMNGLDAIRLLKSEESTKSIPIIMVTGTYGDPEKLRVVLDAGAVDFISKPFNSVELIARIGTHIRQIETFRKSLEQQVIINKQELDLIEKEKVLLTQELEHKSKQLTMQTVNILQHNELLQSVINDINSLLPYTTPEGKTIIKSSVSKLNDKSNEHLWNEFEICFEQVHHDFYKNLGERLSDLTTREKRLCAFLKMNMSTKEIASITFQTPNAIDVAKHRLRKKAGLDSDEEFSNYLLSL
jgi:DNA-binding response OmpR family regulator/DNA-binding CsgD family transcriptional regulator